MAAIVSRLSVGNQAARIRQAFSSQSLERTTSLPKGHDGLGGLTGMRAHFASKGMGQVWWQDLIKSGVETAQKFVLRPQPGTLVQQTPQGTITYRQPEGMQPSLPILPSPMGSQSTAIQTPEGFSTGMALALGAGLIAVVLVMRRK